MKANIKSVVSGIIIGATLTSGIAIAKTGNETLEAWYANIQIMINGTKINPKDANGNTVEPFIVDGTTYLPVRAVGEALGKEVTWDSTTNTVFLTDPALPTPTPTGTPLPTATPVPTITPAPTTTPMKAPSDFSYTTKEILQISGYKEDAIKGEITTAWDNSQKNAAFHAKMRCNNGGLADYIDCEITLQEVISTNEDGFTGYFDVAMNGNIRHRNIKGTVTVDGSKLSLHTEEYDYKLIANLSGEEESKAKLITYYGLQAVKYNGEKATGMFILEYNEGRTNITLDGNFKAGEQTYTIRADEISSITETKIEGIFSVLCDGETVVNYANGTIKDLSAPLGDVMNIDIEGFSNLTLRVVEIGY